MPRERPPASRNLAGNRACAQWRRPDPPPALPGRARRPPLRGARRNEAAALLRIEIDGAGGVEEAHEFRACPKSAAAAENQWALGGGHSRRLARHRPDRVVCTVELRAEIFAEDQIGMDRFPQHIRRDFQVDGTWSGAIPQGGADRLIQITQQCYLPRAACGRAGLPAAGYPCAARLAAAPDRPGRAGRSRR